jgi:hypothetical protein
LGFLVLFFLSFWVVSLLSLFFSVPLWGMLVPLALTMPFFVFYARSVRSELHEENVQAPSRYVTLSSRVAGVRRVVHGHTHHETHTWTGGASSPENSQNSAVELINTGTWSPAFSDFECTQPFGRKPFAWIRPINPGQSRDRVAELREWRDTGSQAIATQEQLALEEKSTALDKRLEQPIADQA